MKVGILGRRSFLHIVGAGALGSFASPARGAEIHDASPMVVQLFLRGGLDGLSAIIPYEESIYFDSRPNIALPMKGKMLAENRLDNRFALHPALSDLLPLYRQGKLAVVLATGLPKVQRSHFDAQDICESGGNDSILEEGWMTRLLADPSRTPRPIDALCIGTNRSRSVLGYPSVLTVPSLNHFSLPGRGKIQERFENALTLMYPEQNSGEAVIDAGAQAMRLLHEMKLVQKAYNGPHRGAVYPKGGLGKDMQTLAELIRQKPALAVATIDSSGWDTHRGQGALQGPLSNALKALGEAISAFHQDLGPEAKRVVIVVMTEFGRSVRENGTKGTDHGHGSFMMVLGDQVRGGLHGTWPGLSPKNLTEARDLRVTTDYRRVLEAVRLRHLNGNKHQSPFEEASLGPGNMNQLFRDRQSVDTNLPTPPVESRP